VLNPDAVKSEDASSFPGGGISASLQQGVQGWSCYRLPQTLFIMPHLESIWLWGALARMTFKFALYMGQNSELLTCRKIWCNTIVYGRANNTGSRANRSEFYFFFYRFYYQIKGCRDKPVDVSLQIVKLSEGLSERWAVQWLFQISCNNRRKYSSNVFADLALDGFTLTWTRVFHGLQGNIRRRR